MNDMNWYCLYIIHMLSVFITHFMYFTSDHMQCASANTYLVLDIFMRFGDPGHSGFKIKTNSVNKTSTQGFF